MAIEHTSVSSSNIQSVGYDPETKTLEVTFKSGRTHEYHNVPEDEYTALVSAPSVGSHFAARIKPSYSGRQIS